MLVQRRSFGYNTKIRMDEIRRKLALIEAQLSGQSLHTRLIEAAGLFFPAVGLIAGILAQHALALPFHPRIALLILPTAALGLAIACASGRLRPSIAAWAAMLCFAAFGTVRLTAFQSVPANDIRRFVGQDRALATVYGRILTEPRSAQSDWSFASVSFVDPPTSFYLKVDRIKATSGWVQATGILRVQVDTPAPHLALGDVVTAYCWLYRFERPTNPGQFDLAAHLARKNICVGASVPSSESIERHQDASRGLLRTVHTRFRAAIGEALLPGAAHVDDPHGLATALLLGERTRIERGTYEAFRKTGLLHFVSLSGMHLGVFAGLIWWLGKAAGLMKRGRALLCIVATAAFLLAVPARAPTVRAAIIVWVFCTAILVRRRTSVLNSLSLAAIILLLIRPTQLFEPGWQLSFAAVGGILALTAPTEFFLNALTCHWFAHRDFSMGWPLYAVKTLGHSALRLLATGVAAWIGGAGILLYHFWTIAPLAAFWTVLVFPLVAVILTLGFVKIVLFFLLPTVSSALGALLTLCTSLLVHVVRLLARLDANTILIGQVSIALICVYYALVLFIRFGRTRRPRLKTAFSVMLTVALLVWIGAIHWTRTHRDHLELTCLDVGHGQAIVVQLPGKQTLLFDAGSMFRRDIGSRIILPFLRCRAIATLDALIISHADIDHINGIPEVVAACNVRRIYADPSFPAQAPDDRTGRLLIASLQENHRKIDPLPEVLPSGPATLRTLWPPEDPEITWALGENDRSLVSLIEFAGTRILLCSDIERPAQQQVMARFPDLRADVVVVPHHGSTTTLDETFLRHLGADVKICSCDNRQYTRRGDRADETNVGEFYTARNGAITVCVESDGVVSTKPYILLPLGD